MIRKSHLISMIAISMIHVSRCLKGKAEVAASDILIKIQLQTAKWNKMKTFNSGFPFPESSRARREAIL